MLNPFTGRWRVPDYACTLEYETNAIWPDKPGCKMFVNRSDTLSFAVALEESPLGASLKSVKWAISSSSPCNTSASCGSTSAAIISSAIANACCNTITFRSIGYAQLLASGRVEQPLSVTARDIQLGEGENYFNFYMCDVFDNCRMETGMYPIFVDTTPPPQPQRSVKADRRYAYDVPYFIEPDFVRPKWNFLNQTDSISDPESGLVRAYSDLYMLRPGDHRGRLHMGRHDLTLMDQNGAPLETPSHIPTSRVSLTLGAAYMLELVQINPAGGISITPSDVVVADWTFPICSPPQLFPASDDEPFVPAFLQPPGSRSDWATRSHNWVSPTTSVVHLP